MISVSGLSKYYSGFAAVEDVSFDIGSGEIVGLLGLNGAGKSTILKVLGCFLMPSAGRVVVGGFDIEESPDEIRKIIGYLPDSPPLYPEMTVESYLHFVAKLKDVSSSNQLQYVNDAMSKTSLESMREVRLSELSHGYRQRVGIAQAIVHKPKVLIFDEPINGLDPVQIVEMRDMIKSFRGEHTVILSSHILSEITRTCDRIIIIDHGKVKAQGGEEELKKTSQEKMKIQLQIAGQSEQWASKLSGLEGISDIQVGTASEEGRLRLTLSCDGDLRARVAKSVIDAGGELLELTRQDDGLESLFVQMIQKGDQA